MGLHAVSLKAHIAGAAIGLGVVVLGLWYVKKQAGDTLSSWGNTLAALPGEAVDAIGQTYSESATLEANNGATLAAGNRQIFGINDSGGTVAPFGSLGISVQQWWNDLTGNDAAGLDFGTGANDWSS